MPSAEDKLRRELLAEDLLARFLTIRRSIPEMAKATGLSFSSCERVLMKVRDRWEQENLTTNREQRRAYLRSTIEMLLSTSTLKQHVLHNADGSVAFDTKGNPLRVSAPDNKTAIRAAELLAKLDGLLTTNVNLTGAAGLAGLVSGVQTDPTNAPITLPSPPMPPVIQKPERGE